MSRWVLTCAFPESERQQKRQNVMIGQQAIHPLPGFRLTNLISAESHPVHEVKTIE